MSKDTKSNAAELLAAYAAELRSETPLLERYTDMMPRPDGLGGEAEREFDKGLRHDLQYPIDATEFELCVALLELLKDRPTAWGALQDALYLCDQSGLALALEKRRERRRTEIDRVIAEAKAVAPEFDTIETLNNIAKEDGETPDKECERIVKSLRKRYVPTDPPTVHEFTPSHIRLLDLREFEAAAKRFDAGIADDVAFIERVACQVAAEPSTRPTERTLLERIDANAQRAASGIDALAEELAAWREWVQILATQKGLHTTPPKLCATIQRKICDLWYDFKNGSADPEMPNGKLRRPSQQRQYDEFLAVHRNDDVWHGQTLNALIPDVETLGRLIHNDKEKKRQQREKQSAAKPPQGNRKKR